MGNGNLFQELHDILVEFRDFLNDNVPTIAPAIQAIASLIPQVVELIDKLIELMDKLKTEINNLDVNAIPGLEEATEFINKIKTFLNAAKSLLPDEQETINDVLAVADVVGSLSGLDSVKQDILQAIEDIKGHLASLKP
jgi:ABC-type transporter Mla subunit MlaD